MSRNQPTIHTDYVLDTAVEPDDRKASASLAENDLNNLHVALVGLARFKQLFNERYPLSQDDPTVLWHNLFGNAPDGASEGCNPDVCYLTEASCQKILDYRDLFAASGIDFQHLPKGFFLTKYPESGVRNVLHFSAYLLDLATRHASTNPLAVILSSKKDVASQEDVAFQPKYTFPLPQSRWYEFLRNKIRPNGVIYCSEAELHAAFVDFSNQVKSLGLKFYDDPDFSACQQECNPIILLGRWHTVLTQPNLKPSDRESQWQQLPNLPLAKGYGALRAITDYQYTASPCGFIVPEMFDARQGTLKFHNIRAVQRLKDIKSAEDFWRYIACQPQRYSIAFYRKALAEIDSMILRHNEHGPMRQILAGSTTGSRPITNITEIAEETAALVAWQDFCNLISGLHTTGIMQFAGTNDPDEVKQGFIKHIHCLDPLPKIPFLYSMTQCINRHLGILSVAESAVKSVVKRVVTNSDPLNSLEKLDILSKKLNILVSTYQTGLYEGARFYFVDGKWSALSMQEYVELQYDLHEINSTVWAILIPYLSTFSIKDVDTGKAIIKSLSSISDAHRDALIYCLSFFKDVIKQQNLATLTTIIDLSKKPTDALSLLEEMQRQDFAAFPSDYFKNKIQQLRDAKQGLTEAQKQKIYALRFDKTSTDAIISIESAMVRDNPRITTPQLEQLNEKFAQLQLTLTSTDFTQCMQRLASIARSMPEDPDILGKLLSSLCQQKTVESFNQVFFRNTIEQANNKDLINKFNLFIGTIKPLGEAQGTISSLHIQDLLVTIVLNCSFNSCLEDGFVTQLNSVLKTLKTVSEAYPHTQQHLLAAFSHIAGKHTAEYFENVLAFTECMNSIVKIFSSATDDRAQQDALTFFAMLANFHQDPLRLVGLCEQLAVLNDTNQQKFFLTMANALIQNKQSLNQFSKLIDIVKYDSDGKLFPMLAKACAHPPYPPISTILEWLKGGENQFKYRCSHFRLRPYGKRRFDFAFNRQQFDSQKSKFIGVQQDVFTDELGDALQKMIRANRLLSVQGLCQAFAKLKTKNTVQPLSKDDKLTLLGICVEMLARTASQCDDSVSPQRISQELNTTQIMALYAMLTHANHQLISEIDTGEGKSRIMMVLAACQVAQGKTVDFITSDMLLAERDYLAYNAFFSALDIGTSLISLNTPKELYQKGGVNFSDDSQLLLLRNKSEIDGQPNAYLEETAKKRCLLVDEVDRFQHDQSQHAYNYAARSSKLNGFTWIYPFLVSFVRQVLADNPKTPFDVSSMKLTTKFIDYLASHDHDVTHQASASHLKEHDEQQLIAWLHAAHTALQLKKDRDYAVTSKDDAKLCLVRDEEGIHHTRKVVVLDNGRIAPGSTFSSGVHQCLCAIENQQAYEFLIQPEHVTQRVSYPVSFMARYAEGHIFGVSGTTRSEAPRSNSKLNDGYAYLLVPRHQTLRRKDQKVWAAKNNSQQLKFIKQGIMKKLKQTPSCPILLICKDDRQSEEIYAALQTDTRFMQLLTQHTRVHSGTEKDDEVKAIAAAGQPGHLTIATAGMFSRGVDIQADDMLVLAAYVPTPHDEKQIQGRTGRFGKPGEYRMIPNLSDPDCPLNGRTSNIHRKIGQVQNKIALNAARHEKIAILYANFLAEMHRVFLVGYEQKNKRNPSGRLLFLETWSTYLNDLQKDWETVYREPLLRVIKTGKTDKQEQFVKLFNEFTTKWTSSINTFIEEENRLPAIQEQAPTTFTAIQEQQRFFKVKKKTIKTQRGYDVADDGQACRYSSLFVQTRAMLLGERPLFANWRAWKQGRGVRCPDLMATLSGERPLFANLRATIDRLIAELKAWWVKQPPVKLQIDVDDVEEDTPYNNYGISIH